MTTAVARPNIALVKYWGKAGDGNRPASPSLSITLDGLITTTRVASSDQDRFELNGAPVQDAKVGAYLRLLRMHHRIPPLSIETRNDFPTGAGLASSASGFAALTVALNAHCGLGFDERACSLWARRGSGSAARSIFGGFVSLDDSGGGPDRDGIDHDETDHDETDHDETDHDETGHHETDSADDAWCAKPLLCPSAWPLEVVIGITSFDPKAVGSSDGMSITRDTSPFFDAWIRSSREDHAAALGAVAQQDFEHLALIAEASCLKMHAAMLSSRPALIYWRGATVEAMRCIRDLRDTGGLAVFFTIDAGPQIKAVCEPGCADAVADALEGIDGVQAVIRARLGEGARVVPE